MELGINLGILGISILGSVYYFRKFPLSFLLFWTICVAKLGGLDIAYVVCAHIFLSFIVIYELYRCVYKTISRHLIDNFFHELFYTKSFVTQYSYQINQCINHMYFMLDGLLRSDLSSNAERDVRAIKQRSFQLAHILEEFTQISNQSQHLKVNFLDEFYATMDELKTAKLFADHIQICTANRPLITEAQQYQCEPHFRSVLVSLILKIVDSMSEVQEPVEILISYQLVSVRDELRIRITVQSSNQLPQMTFNNHYFNYISNKLQVIQLSNQEIVLEIDVTILENVKSIVTASIPLRNLLIVEDDPILGRNLCELFSRRGSRAQYVANGQEALERIKTHEFDLILCDIVMPTMSGLFFLEKAVHRTTCPIQLMTGYPTNFTGPEASIIRKPFDFNQLVYSLQQKGFVLPNDGGNSP